jgi:pyruvate kinase
MEHRKIERTGTFFQRFNLEHILGDSDKIVRKTKVICTIGPACYDSDILCGMLDRGMTVARLNFSHGDHKTHGETIDRLREAFKKRKEIQCAIMLDTKGPEIRTGFLVDKKAIDLVKGQTLEITTDWNHQGTAEKIACSYESLPTSVKVGSLILIADGTVQCKVTELLEKSVKVEVQNNAKLGERKNMNLPGVIVDLPTITPQDEADILFGLSRGVDMIAASFIRKGKDIETIRDLLGPKGAHIKIIAKIENQEGLENFDEILEQTDGIMVARGDLGMEIPVEKVFIAQKWMIKKCNEAGKPVVTATQMFESIIKNPRPTRAECSDVANAVLDGSDAVMLSGETANGDYPLNAVEFMARTCREAEIVFNYKQHYRDLKEKIPDPAPEEAVAAAAVQISLEIGCKVIIAMTETGQQTLNVAKYRPKAHILGVSTDEHVIKSLCVVRGVTALRVPSFQGTDALIEYALKHAKNNNLLQSGDKVLVLQGIQEEDPEQTNVLKVITAP